MEAMFKTTEAVKKKEMGTLKVCPDFNVSRLRYHLKEDARIMQRCVCGMKAREETSFTWSSRGDYLVEYCVVVENQLSN
jgi:hypothetical protein